MLRTICELGFYIIIIHLKKVKMNNELLANF